MRNCPICNKNVQIDYIYTLKLSIVNDMPLNNNLLINFCNNCNFYFSDSNNTQEDYNNYYINFNNYRQENYCIDKDEKCAEYLFKNINLTENQTILYYGSGNGTLANYLLTKYKVEKFDIGMSINNNKYDCLILSHVLEHIFDIDTFIKTISNNIKDDGLLYIEIPNAELYDKITDICPLQEINIEHINFFSKYSLNTLLIKHHYYAIKLEDDFFTLNDMKYYVIRAIFKKHNTNLSFQKYLDNGLEKISAIKFSNLTPYRNIYVYGCGQFLFKIFDNIQQHCSIINIIDDNKCMLNKQINNISIINFELFKKQVNSGDFILLTTIVHDIPIKRKLQTIDNIHILEIFNL